VRTPQQKTAEIIQPSI